MDFDKIIWKLFKINRNEFNRFDRLTAVLSDKIYPLTMISDRYSGAYSGARYLAFNVDFHDMPDEVGGGDTEEEDFWILSGTYKEYKIGKGNTPNDAYYDLYRQLYGG